MHHLTNFWSAMSALASYYGPPLLAVAMIALIVACAYTALSIRITDSTTDTEEN